MNKDEKIMERIREKFAKEVFQAGCIGFMVLSKGGTRGETFSLVTDESALVREGNKAKFKDDPSNDELLATLYDCHVIRTSFKEINKSHLGPMISVTLDLLANKNGKIKTVELVKKMMLKLRGDG